METLKHILSTHSYGDYPYHPIPISLPFKGTEQ